MDDNHEARTEKSTKETCKNLLLEMNESLLVHKWDLFELFNRIRVGHNHQRALGHKSIEALFKLQKVWNSYVETVIECSKLVENEKIHLADKGKLAKNLTSLVMTMAVLDPILETGNSKSHFDQRFEHIIEIEKEKASHKDRVHSETNMLKYVKECLASL